MAAILTAHRPEAERLLLWLLMQRLKPCRLTNLRSLFKRRALPVRPPRGSANLVWLTSSSLSRERTEASLPLASIQPTPMDAATPDAASADADTTTAPRCQGGVRVL